MNKVIGVILSVVGTSLLVFGAIGLFNSALDSREAMLVAGGPVLAAVGISQFRVR